METDTNVMRWKICMEHYKIGLLNGAKLEIWLKMLCMFCTITFFLFLPFKKLEDLSGLHTPLNGFFLLHALTLPVFLYKMYFVHIYLVYMQPKSIIKSIWKCYPILSCPVQCNELLKCYLSETNMTPLLQVLAFAVCRSLRSLC